MSKFKAFAVFLFFFIVAQQAFGMVPEAGVQGVAEPGVVHNSAKIFLWIALLLVSAKLFSLVERWGQPAVLGELVAGIVLGNLGLFGIHFLESIKTNEIVTFLAELGVVILLFQIGLESNISKMRQVGGRALAVAIVGVIVPFVLGAYVVGPLFFKGLSPVAYLFLGAALTATSVGITARIFRDLGKLQMPEAQIILGAAVIDDVLGLVILAIVSSIAVVGSITLGTVTAISLKAFVALGAAVFIGQIFAKKLSYYFSKINTGVGMKFTVAIAFGLIFAYLANEVGLAPIVGAFAAGLVLDPIHFRYFKDQHIVHDLKNFAKDLLPDTQKKLHKLIESHSDRHIEEIIEPVSLFLVPIFFVMTGMNVDLQAFTDSRVILLAAAITVVAILGKIVAGSVAGNVRKGIVGWGMVPRGEVGLIFATMGKSLGVVSEEMFAVIVLMVILTTVFTPIVLTKLLRKEDPSFSLEAAHA